MSPRSRTPWFERSGDRLILRLHIQPGARRNEVVGEHGDRLKIRIAAPPADGKANKQLVRYLARLFGVPQSRVTLLAGLGSRDKRVCIESPEQIPTDLA